MGQLGEGEQGGTLTTQQQMKSVAPRLCLTGSEAAVGGGRWVVRHGHTEDNHQHSYSVENKQRSLPESSWLSLSSHWHRNTAMSLPYPQHPQILPSQAQPLTLATAVQPGTPLFCCPSGHSSGSFGLKALGSRRCLCEGTALTLLKSICKFSWRLASLFLHRPGQTSCCPGS